MVRCLESIVDGGVTLWLHVCAPVCVYACVSRVRMYAGVCALVHVVV